MSDIFAIAASLTIHGNAMEFLERFGAKLLGTHGDLKRLESQLENTHKLAVGLGMVFAGYEGMKGLLHLAEHGKELNHQQSMLLRNGIAYKDVLDETTRAYQKYTQAVPTASGPDFLRTANELVSVKGTLVGADQALVQSLKIEGLIGNATGKSAEGQGYDFWRTVEDKGVIQNKEMTDRVLNALAQGTIATGGKIAGNDWYTYAKRAGTSWMGDSLDALPLQVMEMQTMTATGAGTARKTFANMMEGSQKLTKKQLAAWSQVGMLGSDALPVGHQTEQQRPDLFIQGIIDNLNKQGLDSFDKVKGWAAKAFNRKSADYFMTAYSGMTERDPETGKTRLEKERTNLGRAEGLDKAYDTMMKTDMGANLEALSKQWQSFMEAVGGPLSKAAIPILQDLTNTINKMAAFADKHQQLTELAGDIAFVGSALLMLVGAIKAAKAALAIREALGGAGGGIGLPPGAPASPGGGAAPTGGSPSLLGGPRALGYLMGAGNILYEGYEYTKADPAQRKVMDEGFDKRADANAAAIADFGRLIRDTLPPILRDHVRFSDDAPSPLAPHSEIKVPAAEHRFPPAVEQTFHAIQSALQRQPEPPLSQPARPFTPSAADRNAANLQAALPLMDSNIVATIAKQQPAIQRAVDAIPKIIEDRLTRAGTTLAPAADKAMTSLSSTIEDRLTRVSKVTEPAITASMGQVGNQIAAGASRLPSATSGPISAAFAAIGAQIAHAAASIASGISIPGGGRQAAPTPGAAGGRYHGTSFEGAPPPVRTTTAQAARPQRVAMAMPTIIIENHNYTHLDGHEIKHEVTRRIVADNERHNSVGGADWHGSYAPVGADMADDV